MRMNHSQPVVDLSSIAAAFPDLTSEERQLLLDIRRRKAELLVEISQLKDEITDISTEIDAMDTEEGSVVRFLFNLVKMGVFSVQSRRIWRWGGRSSTWTPRRGSSS